MLSVRKNFGYIYCTCIPRGFVFLEQVRKSSKIIGIWNITAIMAITDILGVIGIMNIIDIMDINIDILVLDLVSQVRNVVLMNVYLGLGNSGGLGFWNGGI